MIPQGNPWLSMWNQPRATVRYLVHTRPTFGIYLLSTVYSLQALFFYLNWWSLGLKFHYSGMITLAVLASPLLAFAWLYFLGYVYYFTGRPLRGQAKVLHLRTCIAWSKIPYSVNLFMWFVLIFASPEKVFIQDVRGISSIFTNLTASIVGVWSFVLLVQSIREIQRFSFLKALFNVALASSVSGIAYFLVFSLYRQYFSH
ncbi:MAG: hypothetical protein ACD_16C00094G0005 [uncultured bacterium]|nr:MAG: hypothetical protein ACD_16C00094G0005 [uncultured bacterium]OGN55999.1 MAG: hypothetical protein A2796_06015 [Chlamydiae bacterium RIFCSPHIGHO2_01_FULL_44_39]OGN58562.1 MAG: hypothetical protein A3C42_06515 [Chlamydiae bacterium RIFCSPHIGHO2_02_FULL_45_9]OGN60615.1 MAG: hypothetical protein A3D96_03365 [Chlamydiae bacterium RIFCSPHIGHO2_12_FULL_44_59]OGN66432.1 MAG: hypothetical protein A2978_03880 [Chlamydiae bacterium RIFCSPLOWO2_01_FULL_44_52]OGN69494.1 MAG: hypothetical protein A3